MLYYLLLHLYKDYLFSGTKLSLKMGFKTISE